MDVVAPPPEIFLSLELMKFSKCSKILVFESSHAKLVERVSTRLFLLIFDNENFPRIWCTLALYVQGHTTPPEILNLGISSLLHALLSLD
jgi:hypothetical protein